MCFPLVFSTNSFCNSSLFFISFLIFLLSRFQVSILNSLFLSISFLHLPSNQSFRCRGFCFLSVFSVVFVITFSIFLHFPSVSCVWFSWDPLFSILSNSLLYLLATYSICSPVISYFTHISPFLLLFWYVQLYFRNN